MKGLVSVKKKNVVAASNVVAAKFGKRHAHVMEAINNLDCGDEFWQPNFRLSNYTVRGKQYDCYLMTRDGFAILCMGFTGKKAMSWKVRYIEAFNVMEQQLLKADKNATDPVWLTQRVQGNIARQEETDVIKDFVEYAAGQGSKSAKFYYKHITNATYKALGLMVQRKPKLRDTMNLYELSELLLAERVARKGIEKYMALGRNYKDIYESVKNDLLSFGSGLRIE